MSLSGTMRIVSLSTLEELFLCQSCEDPCPCQPLGSVLARPVRLHVLVRLVRILVLVRSVKICVCVRPMKICVFLLQASRNDDATPLWGIGHFCFLPRGVIFVDFPGGGYVSSLAPGVWR